MKRDRVRRLAGAALLTCLLLTILLTGMLMATHAACHCVYQAGCPVCLQIQSAQKLVLLTVLLASGFIAAAPLTRAVARAVPPRACFATLVSRKIRMNN